MIAAVYARKSTDQDVAEEQKSVTRQIEGGRAFIDSKGWQLYDEHIYSDDGISGAEFIGRPAFQRMLRAAEARAFEVLVLFDLDRFGRDTLPVMFALKRLADAGVTVYDYSTGQAIDLDSEYGEMMVYLGAWRGKQERQQASKRCTASARRKFEQGWVAGGKIFGYANKQVAKGQTTRVVNEAEAAVVREIYQRAADGQGARTIAANLNQRRVPSPRSQKGRPQGWSSSTVRAVLQRSTYRGEEIHGRTKKAYGRELLKVKRHSKREKGQIPTPESTWLRREVPALRIIDADLAARVDRVRKDRKVRYHASLARGGRVPERAHGKYLLTGGLLVCPTCGGHFEVVKAPWKAEGALYVCATRRRKPGVCSNVLSLPMADTDDTVLSLVEGEVLGTRFIEELLSMVDRGDADNTALLVADRDRLQGELDRLVESIALGTMSNELAAPAIRERQGKIAALDAQLRKPRREQPNIEKLRAALEQRAEQWRAELRSEPRVARLLLRRLVGPLTLWDAAEPASEFVDFDAPTTAGLLEGLVHDGSSPTGFEPVFWP